MLKFFRSCLQKAHPRDRCSFPLKSKLGLLSGILLLVACDEPVDFPQNYVVEGFLYAGEPVDDIRVTSTVSIYEVDVNPSTIQGAEIQIIKNSETIPLLFDQQKFTYLDPTGSLTVNTGDVFELEVSFEGRTSTSQTIVPQPPSGVAISDTVIVIPTIPLNFSTRDVLVDLFNNNRLELTWMNDLEESHYVVIESREPVLDPILPPEIPEEARALIESFRFISDPTEASSFEIIGVALETYGTHVAKVYKINEEYIDLFNSGSQDSRDLNEPPSNIENALGIFTAFAGDSVFFEVVRE